MNEVSFKINYSEEIWALFDKKLDSIFIHKFMPNEVVEWWETDLKIKSGTNLKNLSVRNMEMDVRTDLSGLKKILEINVRQLRIYQFEKPIPNTLEIERLPESKRVVILKQNGLKHFFFIDYGFVTIESFDPEFINRITEKKLRE